MRRLALIFACVLIIGACTDEATTTSTDAPATTPAVAAGPVAPPVRHPGADEVIYFVLTDRFANGDPSNDLGGHPEEAGPVGHGFLPTEPGYFHGGDLAGLTQHLDYIDGLGATAIWITPPFVNSPTLGDGTVSGSSAGYHGYWQVDFTRIDPHLGTDAEMVAMVEAAHALGMKVYLDAVTNHTSDIIRFEERQTPYRWLETTPYLDAAGNPFGLDDAMELGFPPLDAAVSFPYAPVFADEADAAVKRPAWLNDVTLYHNRGSHSDAPEAITLGDFYGLDDLFTEHPRVVEGMIEIYADAIVRYGIDGFRVDTVRHVNDEFWAAWLPAMEATAREEGKDDFFVYGEVFGANPGYNSRFTTELGFPGLLDFGFHDAVVRYVVGDAPSRVMTHHFEDDDLFIDADSNASTLVKFVGNHDIGRLGYALRVEHARANDDELLARMRLANALLFLTRGVPVVFYGDEQGFVGDGGDRHARSDMLPTQVASYMDDNLVGTDATLADGNYDTSHPLYRTIADLTSLRRAHPTLVTGAQIERYSSPKAGVYAATRIDRDQRVEYVVAFNNAPEPKTVTFDTFSPTTWFAGIWGTDERVRTHSSGALQLTVPAFGSVVLQAESEAFPTRAPGLRIETPGGVANPRVWFEVAPEQPGFFEVTFAVSVDGGPTRIIGTDDNPPYRVKWLPPDDFVGAEVVATLTDLVGGTSTVSWSVDG